MVNCTMVVAGVLGPWEVEAWGVDVEDIGWSILLVPDSCSRICSKVSGSW